ncbi:MAG: DUF5668 domain-containing protein [Terracidiphilus sp.]
MSRYMMIRRLRGPAILLLIGVVALLHQAGMLAHFWRLLWPLLLILLGVMMLAERAALAAEGYPLFPGAPWQGGAYPGSANPAAGQGVQQTAASASTAIVPSRPDDFGSGANGGQS